MKSQGLTFSLNDVSFDNSNFNLVPVLLNNPEIKVENERVPEQPQILAMENETKEMIFEQVNKVLTITNDERSQYEPVGYYWFYCVIVNGLAEWKPFSIFDSNRIEEKFLQLKNKMSQNNYPNDLDIEDTCVPTDGGRYDVIVDKNQKLAVYWEEPPMETRRASWFYRPEDESFYLPYSESECDQLEDRYRECIDHNLWHQSFQINCFRISGASSDCCIDSKFVFHSQNTMVEYRRYSNVPENIIKGRVVYRGVESFQNHLSNGESDHIDHVILVIPGIGSICDMSGRGIVECVNSMRSISGTLLQSHFPHYRQGTGRVEFLPVSWHSKFHQSTSHGTNSSSIDKDLGRISLKKVSKLRQFTNHTLIDVLCYSSLTHRQSILSIVASEMNRLRHLFVSRNPQYEGITISLAGHSLGAMIAFDLVTIQGNQMIDPYSASICLKPLEFEIGNVFALGSPISLLLTARGFPCLGSDFRLNQCKGGFFNIFHPFDPVAYLMEPMLVPSWQARPVVIPHHKGRKRLHLELKDNLVRVSHDIKTKLIHTLKNTWNSLQEFATAHKSNLSDDLEDDDMISTLNKIEIDNLPTTVKDDVVSVIDRSDSCFNGDSFIGQLNHGRRVDYVLQEAPLESFNEYLFALGSHACYWDSEDTILMMLTEIYRSLNIIPCSAPSQMANQRLPNPLTNQIKTMSPNLSKSVPPVLPSPPRHPVKIPVLPPAFHNIQTKPFFQPNFISEEFPKDESNNCHINEKKTPERISDKNNFNLLPALSVDIGRPPISKLYHDGIVDRLSVCEKETFQPLPPSSSEERNFNNISLIHYPIDNNSQIDSSSLCQTDNESFGQQPSMDYSSSFVSNGSDQSHLTFPNWIPQNEEVIDLSNPTGNAAVATTCSDPISDWTGTFSYSTETNQDPSSSHNKSSKFVTSGTDQNLTENLQGLGSSFDELDLGVLGNAPFQPIKTDEKINHETQPGIFPLSSFDITSESTNIDFSTKNAGRKLSQNENIVSKPAAAPPIISNLPVILRNQQTNTFQPSMILHDNTDQSIDFYFTSSPSPLPPSFFSSLKSENTYQPKQQQQNELFPMMEESQSKPVDFFNQSHESTAQHSYFVESYGDPVVNSFIPPASQAPVSNPGFMTGESDAKTAQYVQSFAVSNNFVVGEEPSQQIFNSNFGQSSVRDDVSSFCVVPSLITTTAQQQQTNSQFGITFQASDFDYFPSTSQPRRDQLQEIHTPRPLVDNFKKSDEQKRESLGFIGSIGAPSVDSLKSRKDAVQIDSAMTRMSPRQTPRNSSTRSSTSSVSGATVSSVFSSTTPLIPKSGKIFHKK